MKDVHKHERAMHPGKPLTKLRKGGSCYAKGGPTTEMRAANGRGMSKVKNQGGKK